MKFLNLREYGEWLRAKGSAPLHEYGDEILDMLDAADCEEQACDLEEQTCDLVQEKLPERDTYSASIEAAAAQIADLADVRQALVDFGALADDDTETDIGDLVRALIA